MSDDEDLNEASDEVLWQQLGHAQGLARADVLIELGRRSADRGEPARAVTLLDEAASVGEQLDDLRLASHALALQGGVRFGMGDFEASADAYARSAQHSATLGRGDEQAWALCGQADALRALGDWTAAAGTARSARTLAETEELHELAGDACLIQANALYFLDREQDALIACRAGRDHFRVRGAISKVARIDDFALTVRLFLGHLDEALELARNCHLLALSTKSSDDDAYATRRLADVHLRRGELEIARERAQEARALYKLADHPRGIAACDVIVGRVLRERGELEGALESFTEARVLFDATGSDGEALHCDASRSILLHALGQYREAAVVNRRVIDALAEVEPPIDADLPWAVVRLADNLLAAGDADEALRVVDDWRWLWESADEDARVSLLALLEVSACALVELERAPEASEAAEAALALTTESDVNGRTADLYGIRARRLLEAGDPRGRKELAHAIALHLAFGYAERARELSEYFLPDVSSRTSTPELGLGTATAKGGEARGGHGGSQDPRARTRSGTE